MKKVFRGIRTSVGILLCLVFGFTLFCNLTLIIKAYFSPNQPPSVFGQTPMVVLSGSMSGEQEGHLEVGDLILVDKADPNALGVGDVIAYLDGQTIVSHRISGIEIDEHGERLFTTKGDANNAVDAKPVQANSIIGITKYRIPMVGDFAMFLRTPMGILLFVGVPVLFFMIYDLLRQRRIDKQQREESAQMQAEIYRLRKLAEEGKA